MKNITTPNKDKNEDIGKQLMIADFYLDSKLSHNELNEDKIQYANQVISNGFVFKSQVKNLNKFEFKNYLRKKTTVAPVVQS